MFTAVSGLQNHQVRLDVVSNNIANINTIGYKKGRINFRDIISQTISGASPATAGSVGGTNPKQVGLGVTLGSIDAIHNQGNLQLTSVNTDLAIQGNGMFILNDGTNSRYTRSGVFTLDQNGDLVSAMNGWHVQGWNGVNGVISTAGAPTDINIPIGSTIAANATANLDFSGNLDATTAVAAGTDYTSSIYFYDSQGATHTLVFNFDKSAANTWNYTITETDANMAVAAGTPGQLVFNGDGSLNVGASTIPNISVTLTSGATTPQAIIPDFTIATQYAADNSIVVQTQDGYASGSLQSFTIGDSGIITGVYTNGVQQDLAQVGMAHFTNYGGLIREGDTMFSETSNSGTAQLGTANSGGRGSISGGTLEMSNVDLSEEFTAMITGQRGFQANARSITTSDEILQELLAIKR